MKFVFLILLFPLIILSQNNNFVIGINGGAYLANNNTAILYGGNYTSYNVSSIFNNAITKPAFDQFFQYPYSIYDIPIDIKYSLGTEIGFHLWSQKRKSKIYVDINFSDLKVQDFITIAVDDPNNQSVDPNYVPISITGKEKRNMINLGILKTIYQESNISILAPFFLQVLEVKISENFIIVNNQQYNIPHNNSSLNLNQSTSTYGLGIGSGLALNYFIDKDLSFDIGYHIQYCKTNFSKQLNPWGIQQSFFGRIVLNGSKYLSKSNN